MGHDPEGESGRYLAATMSSEQRAAFSEHLLSCQACWGEVQHARAGRAALEQLREVAPVHLRDRVRALVESEAATTVPTRRREARRWLPVAGLAGAAAVVAVLILGSPGALPTEGRPDAAAVQQVVADFRAGVLPSTHLAAGRAPDLSRLALQPVGAAAGSYAGLAVDGFSYVDPRGRRVMLYLSEQAFPEPDGADRLAAAGGPWMVHREDVAVLCAMLPAAPSSRALLVLGRDDQLVTDAARTLGAL